MSAAKLEIRKLQYRVSGGLTLLELLIILVVLSIFVLIALPNFTEFSIRTKVASNQAALRNVAGALEAYHIDNQDYLPWWIPVESSRGVEMTYSQQLYLLTSPIAYIEEVPRDAFQNTKPRTSSNPAKNYSTYLGPVPRYFRFTRQYEESHGSYELMGSDGWTIRCMGPDLDFDLVGDPRDEEIPSLNGFYDPTNGTVSNGDVLRSGGGLNFESAAAAF